MKARPGKLLLLWSLIVLVVASMIVCPSPTRAARGDAEWTVLIYYAADNNLEAQLMRDLNRLEMVGSNRQVNLVVLVDRHYAYWAGSDNWADTRYFHLEKDNNLFFIGSPPLEQPGELNTGAEETLQQFIEWGIQSFPARHYALVIADHGGGWQGAAADETSDDQMIGLAGMQRALGNALASADVDKLDIIVFNACLMGQFEVWSLLAPYADYGVASEEVTYGLDNFSLAVQELTQQPSMSALDFGATIVEHFAAYNQEQENRSNLTMSEVDLGRLDLLQQNLDELAVALREDLASPETTLAVARGLAHSPSFGDADRDFFGMIDLRSFLLILENLSHSPRITAAARQARDTLENVVVARFAGDDVQSVGGLSIFFPTKPRLLEVYTNGFEDVLEPIPGAADSPWVQFLEQYEDALPQVVEIPVVEPVDLSRDVISDDESVKLTTQVGGVGLKEVDLLIGRVEGDDLIAIDSNRILLNRQEIADGLEIPVWDVDTNQVTAGWSGGGWVLSNGERDVRAWIQAVTPGGNIFAVPGYIRGVAGGDDMQAELHFAIDAESGETEYVGAFARQTSGLLGAYDFEPGDALTVRRQVIHLADGSVEEKKGGTLIVGQDPLQLLPAQVPNGTYAFGVKALNLADGDSMQLGQVQVSRLDDGTSYRNQSLSFVTDRPTDWLVKESVGVVTFTPDELSSVAARVVVFPFNQVAKNTSETLDDVMTDMLDTLVRRENVRVGRLTPHGFSDDTLAGRDARRLDYTYSLEAVGDMTGSLVAFVDEGSGQLYMSDLEAPSDSYASEQSGLDIVREEMHLLPSILVARTYTNETMGFSLTYDGYWQLIERPASSEVFLRTASLDGFMRIQERPGKSQPTALDNDTLITIYLDEVLGDQGDLVKHETSAVSVSDLEGRRLDYEYADGAGGLFLGSVVAATTRDGRAYILNGQFQASSPEKDTIARSLDNMIGGFSVFEPHASPVSNPGEGWLVYENEDLHFGLAYFDFLEVIEDFDDPVFPSVKFDYEGVVSVDVGNILLPPDFTSGDESTDELVHNFGRLMRRQLKDVQVGTLADMDLAGIPARGVGYGGYLEIEGERLEMEGTLLVAPTPYGFAYLVNVMMPILFTGDAPVDSNVIPFLLGTFTPLVDNLEPISTTQTTSQLIEYHNEDAGIGASVPESWRVMERPDKVTFTATDELGRRIDNTYISIEYGGQRDAMSPAQMDEILDGLVTEPEGGGRLMEVVSQPADAALGGMVGRRVEFIAVSQVRDLIDYVYVLLQDETGQSYLVTTAVSVPLQDTIQPVMDQIRDSIQLGVE